MNRLLTFLLILISAPGFSQNGIIWYDPVTVADKTYGNLHPRIVLDPNYKPLVLWGDVSGNAFISKWKGKEFDVPVQINDPGRHVFSEAWAGPEMTNHGDTIYVVYKEVPEEKSHILIKHSYDGGRTFSVATEVDDSSDYISRFPTVAIDPYGHPLVPYVKLDQGFTNPRLVVAKSLDLGESFTGETVVPNFSGGRVSDCAAATVIESGNATAILYRDNLDGLRNIWAAVSYSGGTVFKKGVQADNSNWTTKVCPAHAPHGVIISDTIYAVYMSGAGDSSLVYLSKTSVTGLSSTSAPLTGSFTGLASQNYPRIANAGEAAAIVWEQYVNSSMQIDMLFTNEITSGFPARYEKIAGGLPANADVAMGGGHVYVVWQDDSSGNIICRIGSYKETVTNKLLAQNTTITLEQSKSGKYFMVPLTDMASCMMVDMEGREYEVMEIKCSKNGCKVSTEEMDPGLYVVKIFGKDDKLYTYKYEVKEVKEERKGKD